MENIKCVVVGDECKHEKTELCITFFEGKHPDAYVSSVFPPQNKTMHVDGKTVGLSLNDIAGSEEYENTRPLYYPMTDVFVIVFSLTNPPSFESVSSKWQPELKFHCGRAPILLAGANLHLRNDEEAVEKCKRKYKRGPITFEEGLVKAQEIGAYRYVECCALTMEGVNEIFEEAIRAVWNRPTHPHPHEKKKSVFSRLFSRKDKKEKENGDEESSAACKPESTDDGGNDDDGDDDGDDDPTPPIPEDDEPFNPDDVVKGEMIGRGGIGAVFEGTYHRRKVAIKEILNQEYMTDTELSDYKRDVSMMKDLRQEEIVRFIGATVSGKLLIVSEFCRYGSLYNVMEKYPEEFNEFMQVKCLLNAACAMEFLHGIDIVHGDLKPENLLFVSLNPHCNVVAKLSDFGTTRDISVRQSMTKGTRTPVFVAPEVLRGSKTCDKPVDVYSFAVLMYVTFSGILPFEDDPRINGSFAYEKAIVGGKRPSVPPCSSEIQKLMKMCWNGNASKRPTFKEINTELQSVFSKLK